MEYTSKKQYPWNKIYYGFSDDLYSTEWQNHDRIWHVSNVKRTESKPTLNDKCEIMILNKNKFNPTLSIFDGTTYREYPMSEVLNDKETKILSRFHMDAQIVITKILFCLCFLFGVLAHIKNKH